MIKITLRDCCALNQYQQLDANTLSQLRTKCGNVKLLPSSKDYDWVSTKELASNFICNGEIITLGKARYANIKYCKGDFVSANNVIIESNAPSKILTKYLFYYCLKKNKNFPTNCAVWCTQCKILRSFRQKPIIFLPNQ